MADTNRTLAALQAIINDNAAGEISAQDVRDAVYSLFRLANKGELLGIDASGLLGALAVSTDGFVLTLDSGETLGFKWAAAGAHPDLATHDALGLATDAELATHAALATHHAALTIGADAEYTLAAQVLSGADAAAAQKGHIQLAGELAGTAAAPTVVASHSGSTHAAVQAAAEATAAAADATHAAAADPHTGYVREADANYIDLTDGGATALHSHAGGSGHTIRENGTDQTARTGLNFIDADAGAGLITDDAGGDETEVNLGLYVLEAAVPGGELGGTYAVPTVDATHAGSTHSAATDTHIADTADAHDASAISILDTANDFTATDVEGALAELQADAEAHLADSSAAHEHGAIGVTGMKQTLILTAGGGTPTTTSPCEEKQKVEFGTNDRDVWALDFDSATKEYAFWDFAMPSNWDAGTVTAIFHWFANDATTNGVRWGLQAVANGDGEALDVAYGTAQEVTDNQASTANQCRISAATSAITVGGTPAAGDTITFRAYRDPANAGDTLAVDARLMKIVVLYGINTLSA